MRPKQLPFQHSRLFAYATAIGLVALTIALRWSGPSVLGDRALCLSFLPAVALSAYLGGFGPGIVATVLSIVGADMLGFNWAGGLQEIASDEVFQVAVFAVTCLFICGLSESQRRIVRTHQVEMASRIRAEDRLTAEHAVTRILADSSSLEEAAGKILHAVRESLHASAGLLWLPDRTRGVLRCSYVDIVESEALRNFAARSQRDFEFASGVGLPGRVWASREPAWIINLASDANFPRAPIAAEAGLRSGFVFPIRGGQEFFGALEFFTDRLTEPDPALLNMAGAIGSEIGQFVLRRRAEEALRDSEQSLRLALDAGRMGTWEWEIATGKVAWSTGLEAIHGMAPGTFEGTFEAFLANAHPDDRDRIVGEVRQTLEQRRDHHIEYRLLMSDGTVRWSEGRGKLFCDERGHPVRMVGVCIDITERKHAEQERNELLARERQARAEAERASRAKDEFLAVLSHELRTPLTPVLLTVQLLESAPDLPLEHRLDLQTIRRNIELEARLIDDLLDLTRIARGKLQLNIQTVDAHLLLRGALDICHRNEDVDVTVALSASRHFVRADPARLQQVFWNLLNNAHKFTPAGGMITVRSRNSPDGRLRVEVIDSGVGIEPQALPRIFAAFEQGHAQSRRFGGLGLGLAISKALVDAQGGILSAYSDGRGHGSTFSVELPTVASLPTRPLGEHFGSERGAPPRRPLRILVVEDHDATRFVMTKLLRDMGYEPLPAAGMESAMKLAKENGLDLVISDLGLPDGSGHELMRWIRAQHGVRGIALSGYGMEEDLRRSEEAGFAEHLIKPIDLARLQAAIRRVTEQPVGAG